MAAADSLTPPLPHSTPHTITTTGQPIRSQHSSSDEDQCVSMEEASGDKEPRWASCPPHLHPLTPSPLACSCCSGDGLGEYGAEQEQMSEASTPPHPHSHPATHHTPTATEQLTDSSEVDDTSDFGDESLVDTAQRWGGVQVKAVFFTFPYPRGLWYQ